MNDPVAKTRLAQLAADEGPHIDNVRVPKALLRRLLVLLESPVVCPACNEREAFNLEGHMNVPSRHPDKALCAAAAVNLSKASRA